MAKWLVGRTLDWATQVRAIAGAVVFLSKTLYSPSATPHPGV